MQQLTLWDTTISLVPLLIGIVIYAWCQLKTAELLIAAGRMLLQLVAIGYVLAFLFRYDWPWLGMIIMTFMLVLSSIITIRPLQETSRNNWLIALLSLFIAGSFNLIWMLFAVLNLSPWYQPTIVIPLAGMVFANGMNALSVGAERYEQEIKRHNPQAALQAFNAAMIPQINTLLAVGLVSLPGMMTGQILSGISPLLAVRYQIMVMSMVASTAIIALAIYFYFQGKINNATDE